MRAEQHVGVQLDEEGVLHITGRMFFREVEGGEHMPIVLDVGTFHGGEADVFENPAHLVHHDGNRVHGTDGLLRGGTGDVGNSGGLLGCGSANSSLELIIMALGQIPQLVY